MAEWVNIDGIDSYEDAVQTLFEAIGMRVDPRKVLWCNYPLFLQERGELEEKVRKDTRKLEREIDDDLCLSKLWYVGIPRFKLIRRGVAHFSCDVDLYYVACDTTDDYPYCWYGKLIPKADKFDVPLCLITPLIDALSQGQLETDNAKAVERGCGYTVYDYLGREWKIPDAFLGFVWALKDKGSGFDGLLDPMSCSLMDRFTKELPSPEIPKLTTGNYEELISAVRNLGWTKVEAEEAARYVMERHCDASLEEKIKYASIIPKHDLYLC